jgi:hypothetical protein
MYSAVVLFLRRSVREQQAMMFSLKWWQIIVGLLALWSLLDLSFALAGWLGMAAPLGLIGLAIFTRNRLPWVKRGIETILGLALLAQVWTITLGLLNPSPAVIRWIVIALLALAGILGAGLFRRVLSRRRRAG